MAVVAGAITLLLALHAAGAGFQGDPLSVVRDAAPGDRLWDVADRRAPVVGVTLLVWLAAFGLAMAIDRERAGRAAARLLALSLIYLPLLCLLGAALEPSVGIERLLLMLGSPALAAVTLAVLGGYRAVAVACATTTLAYSVDLITGSPLTQLSLVGPNPAAGHRYYGIGNELEACLTVLVLIGTGAALSTFYVPERVKSSQRGLEARGPVVFLVVAAVFAFVFAYGRYGADVGAAIALPLGAAVAAALLADRRDLALLAFALPIPALALLAAADLLSGANAHLTSTVLDADSGGDVLGVVGHRLREMGESFGRPLLLPGLPVVIAAAVIAWLRRDRLEAWLRPVPAMRAALLGALAATLVGTLANDSGALLLEIGSVYLLALAAYAWAESEPTDAARRIL
ncbi:MAG: hypothetical protein ABW196_00495 [Solirubrobacterales bacterium]